MTEPLRNVLFIMCDQLRFDALSCSGGVVDPPNLDALAARGVRFDRAFVQGSVCGSSRMSAYTGRYVQSHGSRYNGVPLPIGERTIGDHLHPPGHEHLRGGAPRRRDCPGCMPPVHGEVVLLGGGR